ncbi:MAG: outer membrane protein assembly factor BamD [Methylococcaceae bacterium]
MRLIFIKFLFIFYLSASLQGCATLTDLFSGDSSSSEEDEYVGWNAEKFRTEAKMAVDSGSYEKAIKLYEALESRYPFGESSAQTQLDIAYAYYKNGDPDSAIAAADRFIKINPRNPHVDYAFYLKGLVNYNRGIGFLDRFLPTDTSQRDPGSARDAYDNFAELIRRFPGSKYLSDARLRMIALKNNMAMHEVHVARYYLKRKAYIAAANRASGVIEKYQRTPAVPFALQVLQEAYTKLDMKDLAKDVEYVYAENYPNGPPVPEHKDATVSHRVWNFIGLEK